jgi:alpha-amylase/alpha-mannosidase (GH57 family)
MEQKQQKRYLVVHGHFYQPPRENPWTERIERQRSASPYHDWNERITRECYLPNTRSRRLDGYGRITRLVNNYEWISFNFGPTLLSWLEETHREVYEKILDADRTSAARLGGHGNAIAQAYNHIIMPLANRHDRETQIVWGRRDFVRRFGREPEGLWLPETAINDETLSMTINAGFSFLVLSPTQAESVRSLAKRGAWNDVSDGSIPTGSPYRCFGRGGGRGASYIDIFFYDSPLAHDVSFNHLLRNGDAFAEAVSQAYPRTKGDLVVIATDGENYGHHEPFADMALAYLIDEGAPKNGFALTNFAAYLESAAPAYEVRLKQGPHGEGTSWSCVHGVGRWKENCGCNTGAPSGWNQAWRSPLRKGLNVLRDTLADLFEQEGGRLLTDPWKARNDYIDVLENRTLETSEAFVTTHAARRLDRSERARALTLLESQRNALLMFTSCGWFFNDISGIETVQLLMYAARAIELSGDDSLEKILLELLATAKSNINGVGTGADLYRDATHGTAVNMPALVAQHAIYSFLFGPDESLEIFGHFFEPGETSTLELDSTVIQMGSVKVTSPYSLDARSWNYALFIEREAGYRCFLGESASRKELQGLERAAARAVAKGNAGELLDEAAKLFPRLSYRLADLNPEDRERVLRTLAVNKLEALEEGYRKLYLETRDLLKMLAESSIETTQGLLVPARTTLTRMLLTEIEEWEHSLDTEQLSGIRNVLAEASYYGVPIDKSAATEAFTELVNEKIRGLSARLDPHLPRALLGFVSLVDEIGVALEEGPIQNILYPILESRVFPLLEGTGGTPGDAQGPVKTGPGVVASGTGPGAWWDGQGLQPMIDLLGIAQRFNFNVDRWLEIATAPREVTRTEGGG